MGTVHITGPLQKADVQPGRVYRLYIYDDTGHWIYRAHFEKTPKYPEDGDISSAQAKAEVEKAMHHKNEVRITDGGDMLIFHSMYGVVLHPLPFDHFWETVGA